MLVKLGIFPKDRGENNKYLSCHQLANLSGQMWGNKSDRIHDRPLQVTPRSARDPAFSPAKLSQVGTGLRVSRWDARESCVLRFIFLAKKRETRFKMGLVVQMIFFSNKT